MNLKEQVLSEWTKCKSKIEKLKVNQKDNWALLKPKSTPISVSLLTTPDITTLCRLIATHQNQIKKMDERSRKALLSLTDQAKYERLTKKLSILQSKLENQRRLALNWQEPLPTPSPIALEKLTQEYQQKLGAVNEKHDQLTDKLNWLRTLVRAGDLIKLQDLVRKGKV